MNSNFMQNVSRTYKPSYSDKMITQKIIEAAELMDIRILDHFIVGKGTCYSFAEHNLL